MQCPGWSTVQVTWTEHRWENKGGHVGSTQGGAQQEVTCAKPGWGGGPSERSRGQNPGWRGAQQEVTWAASRLGPSGRSHAKACYMWTYSVTCAN